jgi:hypothetical protein
VCPQGMFPNAMGYSPLHRVVKIRQQTWPPPDAGGVCAVRSNDVVAVCTVPATGVLPDLRLRSCARFAVGYVAASLSF